MYRIQEAQLQVPQLQSDRSVNVLTFVEPQSQAPFQIIINRDSLLGEETVPQCFNRQLELVGRQVRQFKVLRRIEQKREGGRQPLYTIETTFTQGGQSCHQLQCLLITEAPRILVITLSSAIPLKPGHRAIWAALVEDLDPALPVAGS